MEPGPAIPPEAVGPDALTARSEEAMALWGQGNYREAELVMLEVVEGHKESLGEDHPVTLSSLSSLASVLYWQGRYADAETILRRALEGRRKVLGDDHPSTRATRNELGLVLNRLGKYPEVLGRDHARALSSMVRTANALCGEERYTEADALLREALHTYKTVRGMDHPKTLDCMRSLSMVLVNQGRLEEADKLDRVVGGEQKEPERSSSVCYLGEFTDAVRSSR